VATIKFTFMDRKSAWQLEKPGGSVRFRSSERTRQVVKATPSCAVTRRKRALSFAAQVSIVSDGSGEVDSLQAHALSGAQSKLRTGLAEIGAILRNSGPLTKSLA
jgi:hypothetical protein